MRARGNQDGVTVLLAACDVVGHPTVQSMEGKSGLLFVWFVPCIGIPERCIR